MDVLETMRVFVRVAERSGFAAAARDLRLSPATVTKHVAALETRIGSRLLERTTRRVSLTEAGRIYYERSRECLQACADADASVTELMKTPRGLLRIAAPVELGQGHIAELLVPFMMAHPGISVELRLSNRAPDLVEEGIDLSIRVVRSVDAQYIARPLAVSRLAMWGAPAYLRAHGRPRRPEELTSHRHLVFTEPTVRDELVFERDGAVKRMKLAAIMMSNNAEALRVGLLQGVGLAVMPSFMALPDVDAGRIERVLPDWSIGELRFMAVYPQRRFLSAKVRAFLEALKAAHGDGSRDPWWSPAFDRRRVVRRR